MSTTTLSVQLAMTAREVLSAADAPLSSAENDRDLQINGLNQALSLTSASDPAIEQPPVVQTVTLGGSPTTIDLTAAPLQAGRTEDMTGEKLIGFALRARDDNAGNMTIKPSASNGYNLFGGGTGLVILGPGQQINSIFVGVNSNLPAVAAGAKNIEISGTSGDVLDVLLFFGD